MTVTELSVYQTAPGVSADDPGLLAALSNLKGSPEDDFGPAFFFFVDIDNPRYIYGLRIWSCKPYHVEHFAFRRTINMLRTLVNGKMCFLYRERYAYPDGTSRELTSFDCLHRLLQTAPILVIGRYILPEGHDAGAEDFRETLSSQHRAPCGSVWGLGLEALPKGVTMAISGWENHMQYERAIHATCPQDMDPYEWFAHYDQTMRMRQLRLDEASAGSSIEDDIMPPPVEDGDDLMPAPWGDRNDVLHIPWEDGDNIVRPSVEDGDDIRPPPVEDGDDLIPAPVEDDAISIPPRARNWVTRPRSLTC